MSMACLTREFSDAGLGSEQLCFLVNSNAVYLGEQKPAGPQCCCVIPDWRKSCLPHPEKRETRFWWCFSENNALLLESVGSGNSP